MSVTPSDMDFVKSLVLQRSSIALDDQQQYLVESRLVSLAREVGAADISGLIDVLRGKPYGELHRRVVEAMTTNETSFFRDVHPFETIRKKIIPTLMVQRALEKRLSIWSAACSSGQEPYSVLMLLRDEFPQLLSGWTLNFYASDFASTMVARSRAGKYNSLDVGRGLPAPCLVRHFDREGAGWQVKATLRQQINWFQLNLADAWPPLPIFDLIIMRNVLIYFKPETRAAILEKTRRAMQPNGFLLLGTTETTHGLTTALTPESFGTTVYYRITNHHRRPAGKGETR